LREYELMVIIDPDLEMDIDKPLKKVEDIIKDNGGKVAKKDVWGKKRLAYQINKHDFGVYVLMNIEVPPVSVGKIENTLNITKEVMRYIITNPVPEVVFPGRPERAAEEESKKEDEAPKKKAASKKED